MHNSKIKHTFLQRLKKGLIFLHNNGASKTIAKIKEKAFNKTSKSKNYEYYIALPPSRYKKELCIWYRKETGKRLNLRNPQTYNEKIQWLKLYDTTQLKTQLADKKQVRKWVARKIGNEYLIPILGTWDSLDEINFQLLPEQFVLKCNHGCGWNLIVKDKSKMDFNAAKAKFNRWLSTNFAFKYGFELQYKDIQPCIIAEKYINNSDGDLHDYKFWCFEGEVKYIMYLSERNISHLKMTFYSIDWVPLNISYNYEKHLSPAPKPSNLDEMLNIAKVLSAGFHFVRVDLYVLDDGIIKFGEMTFTPYSGVCRWNPPEADAMLGKLIAL